MSVTRWSDKNARRSNAGLKAWKPGEPGCRAGLIQSALADFVEFSPEFQLRALPDKKLSALSRRSFLDLTSRVVLAVAGAAATLGLGKYLTFDPNPPPRTRFTIGLPEAYPIGSVTHVAEARAWLVRDERGFFAMSGVCTHLGCSVKPASEGFECPCHGSRYAPDGRVLSGRAGRPLRRIFVGQDDAGHLWIDTAREVDADFRAA